MALGKRYRGGALVSTTKKRMAPYMSSVGKRSRILAPQKGFVQVSGYYGRFRSRGRRATDVEMKYRDNTFGPTTILTTGTVAMATICNVAQGDAENQRIGRKITIKKINIRGTLPYVEGATNTASEWTRIMVVLDKQCNGTTVTPDLYLQTQDVYSYRNLVNSSRFQTLWERKFTFNKTPYWNGTAALAPEAVMTWNVNLKGNWTIEYDATATTGAVTTIRSNNIFILAINETGATQIKGTVRIRYTDI